MKSTARSTTTLRYAFDDTNRLVVRERDDGNRTWLPRRVLEGRVHTDRGNRLIYQVDSSASADGAQTPRAFNLDGTWTLTPNHELALTLHERQRQGGQTIYLKGALVNAEASALVFALRRSEQEGLDTAEQITLSGRWQTDAKNRLNFLVAKADGSEDRLTFQGGWEVGKHHELIYRYRQRAQSGRIASEQTLMFDGSWDITKTDRLVYRIAGSDRSVFEFKASLQSPSLLARDERIVYQVGIGLSGGRVQRQRVTLFGAWKLNRDLSVSFEIPYAGGRVERIRFEGAYAFSPRDRLAVALQNSEREPLGLTVTFTKNMVRDASLFLRLRKDAEEQSIVGGVQVRF